MIYFIACQAADAVKIGYVRRGFHASDESAAFARLGQAQVNCPHSLELLAICEGDLAAERALHIRFWASRLRGEWFRLTDEIVRHIAQFPKPVRPPRGWRSQSRNRAAA